MQTNDIKMGKAEWGLLILLACLWGTSFLFMRIATRDMPVLTVAFGRIGIAAIAMLAAVFYRGFKLPTALATWAQLTLLGFLRATLPIVLFVWASVRIESGVSGILNSTTPLFTAIVAHFFTSDEKLTSRRMVGILLGMTGIVFLIGPAALQGLRSNVAAQLAILAATASYGFAAVYGRRFKQLPVLVSTASFLLAATIIIAPFALIVDQPWQIRPSALSLAAVVALGIFNTAIAFFVWLTLILRAGANNTSQVTFLIPIVALVLGVMVLNEQIQPEAIVGLVLILLGLATAQGRFSRR